MTNKDNIPSSRKKGPPLAFKPRLGPGLFGCDPRAAASAESAFAKANNLPKHVAIDIDAAPWLRSSLLKIARWYWYYWDEDKRTSSGERFGKIKAELQLFEAILAKSLRAFTELSQDAKRVLRSEIEHPAPNTSENGNIIKQTESSIRRLAAASKSITDQNYSKDRAKALSMCCGSLWHLREQVTKRRFARTWDKQEQQFISPDALFVQILMQAIDVNVSFEQLEAALRRVAKSESERQHLILEIDNDEGANLESKVEPAAFPP